MPSALPVGAALGAGVEQEPVRTGTAERTDPWTLVHLGTLGAAAVVLFVANRGQWFYGDDWEFLVNRGFDHPVLDVFATHNEHWSTVPVTVYVVLRDMFGLGSTTPFVLVLIAVHLTSTHLLWRVCRRAGVREPVATAAAAVFAVFGAGGENLLWTFQIGFIGSITAGWAAVLLVDHAGTRPGRRDVWAALVLTVGVACSGIGVPAVGLCVLVAWARARSLVRPVLVGGVPALAFLLWYVTAGSIAPETWYAIVGREQPGVPAAAWDDGPVALAEFVVRATRDTLFATTGLPATLVLVLLVALAGWAVVRIVAVVRDRPGAARTIGPVAGLLAAGGFFVLSGFGRAQTDASRYVYVAVGFALPGLVLALWELARFVGRRADRRVAPALAVLVLIPVLVHNLVLLDQRSRTDAVAETAFRSLVLGSAHLLAAGEPVLADQVDPVLNPDLSTAHLAALTAAGDIPADADDAAGLLQARLVLQVVVAESAGPVDPAAAAPTLVPPAPGETVQILSTGAGCLRVTSETEQSVHLLSPGGPAQFTVQSDAPDLVLTLVDGDRSSGPRVVRTAPPTPADLRTVLPAGLMLSVVVPSSGLTLCGVR